MTDGAEDDSATPHGYSPPEREKTDCDRCGEGGVLVEVDRKEPALCDGCEEYVASLEPPDDPDGEREITPMDRRWRQ